MRYLIVATCSIFVMWFLCACGAERVVIDPVGYKVISQGEEITEEDAAQIIDGETTRDDIYLIFGKPTSILEDGHVFVYNWVRGGEGNVLGFGTGDAKAHSLIVTFDANDIATGHRITRGNVPTASVGD